MEESDDNMKRTEGFEKRKKASRILTGVFLVVYCLYHLAVQYYAALDSRLLVPSWEGFVALAHYESGRYEDASRHWRGLYGLAYDPSNSEAFQLLLSDKIRKEPDKLGNYCTLADLYFSRGDYDSAEATYRSALARDKTDYDAKIGLATCLAIQGNYRDSQSVFVSLFRQSYQPQYAQSFLNILVAIDRLEHRKNDGNAELYLTLSQLNRYLHIIDKRREEAVLSYADTALKLNANLDEAFVCKGVMFAKKGEYGLALAQFENSVRINPGNPDTYSRMSFAYGMLGDPEKELACDRKAVELAQNDPLYAYKLGELLQEKFGDLGQASYYYRKALELKPGDYQLLSSYGYSLMLLKEYDKALEVSNLMIQKFPTFPYGFQLKADCFKGMKRYEEAVKYYLMYRDVADRAGLDSRDDFQALTSLGDAYAKLKKTSDAVAAYRDALKFKPYDVEALYTLQYLYRRQGMYKEAYAAVKDILRIQPDHGGARRLLPYLAQNVAGGSAQ